MARKKSLFRSLAAGTKDYPLGMTTVEICRVAAGERWLVNPLTDGYSGLLTHIGAKGLGPEVCRGPNCPSATHHKPIMWKGYSPIELWIEAAKTWIISVLEITERLDHVFDGRFTRGTTWRIERPGTEPNGPLTATKLIITNMPQLSDAFDPVPTLIRFYRYPLLMLNADNPVPRPQLQLPRAGESPIIEGETTQKPLTAAEIRARLASAAVGSNGSAAKK